MDYCYLCDKKIWNNNTGYIGPDIYSKDKDYILTVAYCKECTEIEYKNGRIITEYTTKLY